MPEQEADILFNRFQCRIGALGTRQRPIRLEPEVQRRPGPSRIRNYGVGTVISLGIAGSALLATIWGLGTVSKQAFQPMTISTPIVPPLAQAAPIPGN